MSLTIRNTHSRKTDQTGRISNRHDILHVGFAMQLILSRFILDIINYINYVNRLQGGIENQPLFVLLLCGLTF